MLICIPDISGFTKFMSEAENDLSSKVIPSLLNNIIYSNDIGLKVSEIEGDAVLFYKKGGLPSIKDLIDQCINFYKQFHEQLNSLDDKYSYLNDGEPLSKTLGLKIILHYGEDVDAVNIGKHIKLMGEDVIVAHKLLKNTINKDEYVLLTESLMDQYSSTDLDKRIFWSNTKLGDENYKHIGEINYAYINLEPLKNIK